MNSAISISKGCIKCGEPKPLTEFGRRSDSPDGHRNECLGCYNARIREYQRHWHKTPAGRDCLRKVWRRTTAERWHQNKHHRERIKRNSCRFSKTHNDRSRRTAYSNGRRWETSEELQVLTSQLTDRQLSIRIGRTMLAIRNRRNRLKCEQGIFQT
jgi:hypothetical protein